MIFKQGFGADMFYLHQLDQERQARPLIGNTYGKYIARDEDMPFLRFGFPIIDRCGHTYFPTVGYRGAMRLLEKMLDLFLDRQDRDAPEEKFELVLVSQRSLGSSQSSPMPRVRARGTPIGRWSQVEGS